MGKLIDSRDAILKNIRPLRNGSIKTRWVLNSLALVALIIIIGISAYMLAVSNYYYASVRLGLESSADNVASFFSNYVFTGFEEYTQSAKSYTMDFQDKDKLELQFIKSDGRVEASTSGLGAGLQPKTDDIAECMKTGKVVSWMGEDPSTGERILSVSGPLTFSNNEIIGVMRYVTSLSAVDAQVFYSFLGAVAIGIGVMIIVIIPNLYFIRTIIKPIQNLNKFAKNIAEGSYGAQIQKSFDDEIGELCDTINEMSTEIKTAERMKTDFISSVSHELRTPLTAISGWSETLMSVNDPAEVRKGIKIIQSESVRLTKLVEELLDFTRLEGGRMKMQIAEMDVRAVLEEAVYMFMDILKRDGIELIYNDPDDIPMISGDQERLKQVFLNILDNAAKHGAEGQKIEVSLDADESSVYVNVRDFGAGIPDEELPHVKSKFYKGSTKSRGSGIGLAISDEIVRMHGGTVDIYSTIGSGTMVRITLPIDLGAQNN